MNRSECTGSLPGKWRHWSCFEVDYSQHEASLHELAIKTRSLYLQQDYWDPFFEKIHMTIHFNDLGTFEHLHVSKSQVNDSRPLSVQWRDVFLAPPELYKTMAFELGELEQDARYNTIHLFRNVLVPSDVALIIYAYASDLLEMVMYCKSKAVG